MSDEIPFDELMADIDEIRFRDFSRIDPSVAARLLKLRCLPFRIHPDFGREYVTTIDPGPIPSTYVHSWAVDLSNFVKFRLAAAQDGVDLNWGHGDHVEIYVPETGQVTKISTERDLRTQRIDLKPLPSAFPVRVYIILRTSVERWVSGTDRRHRRFRLLGVYPFDAVGDPTAVLVGDDLNRDVSKAPNQDPWFDDGSKENPLHGWVQGRNTLTSAKVEEPRPDEGWQLLARFTPPPGRASDMHLYALVYYNEQISNLRIYLLPGPRLDGATGIEVRVRLMGRNPNSRADYVKLEGAFFDDDTRPHAWSEALLVVPSLASKKWTMVETKMLYPMAKDLPGGEDTSGPGLITDEGVTTQDPRFPSQQEWYRPIYDSTFEGYEAWMGNIRLQFEITPFTRGEADLDFIGEGVGQAIQEFNSQGDSFLKTLKDCVSSAIDTGKGAYGAADWIHKKVKESHKKKHPNVPLPGLLGLGGGALTGAVTAVAAGVAFFVKAFSTPEAMRLALELKIRGTITGSIYTPLTKAVFDCFLPGRFDAREMHLTEGVALADPALHQLLPRYDRSLGHLGYRYDPTRLKCRALYFGPMDEADPSHEIVSAAIKYAWPWGMRCVWPAPEAPQYPYYDFKEPWRWKWGLKSPNHPAPIDGFLPIVFNEFAEIVPINPSGSLRTQLPDVSEDPHQPTHGHFGNVAYAHHLDPEPGDTTFPTAVEEQGPVGGRSVWVFHDGDWEPHGAWDGTLEDSALAGKKLTYVEQEKGYWLDAGAGDWVPPLRDFTHGPYVLTHDFGQLSVLLYDEDSKNDHPSVESFQFGGGVKLDNRHFRPFEPGRPWPLANVVFGRDVRYLYYGRSRQQASGHVPRRNVSRPMSSPVTFAIMGLECDYEMRTYCWGDTTKDKNAPSIMMLDKPW